MSTDNKKRSILIVDDDEDLLEAFTAMVSSLNYTVISAQTLPSALIKINNQEFNVILLDVHLKRVSGLRVVDQIRRNYSSMNHNTPIILHSGNIDPTLIDRYRVDIDDALVKPASLEVIRNKLIQWHEKKHVGHSQIGGLHIRKSA